MQLPKNANKKCKSAKLLFFYQDTHGWLAPANGTTWPQESKLSPKRNFTKLPQKSHRKNCSSPCLPEQRFLLSGKGKRQLTKREKTVRSHCAASQPRLALSALAANHTSFF